ncbi:MAG: hypothetical protein ACLUQK_13660 [Clostridium sp.]
MKKNIASSLLLLMGMLSCFGVFLFSFPFWDQILWLLYLPVLLLALLVFHQLLLHRKKKSILLLSGLLALAGVFSFPVLLEGGHIAYNVITDVYHTYSGYVFYPYDISDTAFLCQLQVTWLLLYVSIWLFCGMLAFWRSRHYFALFMLSFLPVFFVLLYQTPIPWLSAMPLIVFWLTLLLSRKGAKNGNTSCPSECPCFECVLCILYIFDHTAGFL